ncbi:pleckstrin homology domain-containing family G member 1-like, partial [Stegostoma tigrinum]|uniref:pleckstrin homology domain-containing family G member 1-like n=1 Tax=Stegostoma tigrinum TaxID=3053191 RepID=UPI00286FC1FF
MRSMDSSDRDRPVSYGSTSSSASSRDSHCSLSSGMTLVSNSHLGLAGQEKEAGAIRLELIPTGHLSSTNDCAKINLPRMNSGEVDEKRTGDFAIKRVDSRGSHKNRAVSPGAASVRPGLLYVDRVVQEILETERTYVEDLRSIVKAIKYLTGKYSGTSPAVWNFVRTLQQVQDTLRTRTLTLKQDCSLASNWKLGPFLRTVEGFCKVDIQ